MSRWVDVALLLAVVLWIAGIEPRWIEVTQDVAPIRGLPEAAEGLRIAVLTDIHHGPWLSRGRVRAIVSRTNALQPDVIVILGDVVHRDARYIAPVWEELSRLQAPLGVYAVLGNHEHWEGAGESRQAILGAGVENLEGRAVQLAGGRNALYLVGLGELMETRPSLTEAMRAVGQDDVAIVITHNPDVFEQQHDRRARLWLAGHTHGGQIYLPWLFRAWVPSLYGQKYRAGWVERDGCRIYVSRGLGCITPPVRLNCRPELPVIELRRAP